MSFKNYKKIFNQLIILLLIFIKLNFAYKCHSCLQSCKTTIDNQLLNKTCDCVTNKQNKNETMCFGKQCFVKIEFFSDESIAIIQV